MRRVLTAPMLAAVVAAWLSGGCGRVAMPTEPTSLTGVPATTETLVNVTADLLDVLTGYTGTDNWPGQSATIPGSGSYNNIRFNWYHYNPSGNPVAFGTLYLLTQEYLGLAGDLGPSTAGFVARSERVSDGQYIFPPGTTLVAGRKYWFYSDARGQFTHSFNRDIYSGGDLYTTGYHARGFTKSQASWLLLPSGIYLKPEPGTGIDANFKLQGAPVQ